MSADNPEGVGVYTKEDTENALIQDLRQLARVLSKLKHQNRLPRELEDFTPSRWPALQMVLAEVELMIPDNEQKPSQ